MNKAGDHIPFYQQIKNLFIQEIESGKWKQGDKLPSERELAAQYQISRMTARHAISILEREGFVERVVGSGTFVTNRRIQLDFVEFTSFSKNILSKGLRPSTNTIYKRKEPANGFVAKMLGIAEEEEIWSIKRVRYADEIPVSIELSYIPYAYCPGIEAHMNLEDISLYEVLEEHYGIKLVRADQTMRISLSDEAESKLLRVGNDSPCILVEAQAFDKNDKLIEFSQALTRGDIVRFFSKLNVKNN
ncbi:GntR family transcriptional regulator [Paenibacillus sp. A3]|uniref:GntR family transcriptional regulator n=1 Tax=Paenibacillus TaxID=44249 RepID=UPI0006D59736|nr:MULTISPECIES: GntR family transcriptional regulator [Paenibacillus]KPV59636.1 GntR family transcriptional regulator [Paenibacillus sp. A3]MBU7318254.1 GntR family transcriptional regulator [Paenibacillus oleatilyticus]